MRRLFPVCWIQLVKAEALKEYFTQKLNYVLISSHSCRSKPMTSYHETHGEFFEMVLLGGFSVQ